MNLLLSEIVDPLSGLLERALEQVVYHPLKGECTADDLNSSNYIGGEIALFFESEAPRYFSWAENAGWHSHFTLVVSRQSAFGPGTLETFDASKTSLWRDVIGQKLTEVECIGWDRSPHVLKLAFGTFRRLVGSSYQKRFGDGDDLYFCDEAEKPDLADAAVIWRSASEKGQSN